MTENIKNWIFNADTGISAKKEDQKTRILAGNRGLNAGTKRLLQDFVMDTIKSPMEV